MTAETPPRLVRRDRVMLAVAVMLDIAFHSGRSATVSTADAAGRLGLARRGMEPLLQTLSRTGLLESVRGPRGGYRLGRARRDITLADIAEAVGEAEAGGGLGGDLCRVVVGPLWAGLDDMLVERLRNVTLDDLLRQALEAGLRRPATEPITFAI
jgi:Rrf2 family protein